MLQIRDSTISIEGGFHSFGVNRFVQYVIMTAPQSMESQISSEQAFILCNISYCTFQYIKPNTEEPCSNCPSNSLELPITFWGTAFYLHCEATIFCLCDLSQVTTLHLSNKHSYIIRQEPSCSNRSASIQILAFDDLWTCNWIIDANQLVIDTLKLIKIQQTVGFWEAGPQLFCSGFGSQIQAENS